MKILYGVQGTGNGHIARARAMSKAFESHDVQVDFLFWTSTGEILFNGSVWRLSDSSRFYVCDGKRLGQLRQNGLEQQFDSFFKEVNQLNLAPYDLIINDFEPVTAWAARQQNKPCIGISHQMRFAIQCL